MSANQRQKASPAFPLSLGALAMGVTNTDRRTTRAVEGTEDEREAESDGKAPTKPESSGRGPAIAGKLPPPSNRLGLAISRVEGVSLYQQFHQQQQQALRNAQQEGCGEASHQNPERDKKEDKGGEVGAHVTPLPSSFPSSSVPQYGRRADKDSDSSVNRRVSDERGTRNTYTQDGTHMNHGLMNRSETRHYLLHRKQQVDLPRREGRDGDFEDAEVARTSVVARPNPPPSYPYSSSFSSARPTRAPPESEYSEGHVQGDKPSAASASHGRRSASPAPKAGTADEATIGGNTRRQGRRAEEKKEEMDDEQNCIKDVHTGRLHLNRDDEEQQRPHLSKSGYSSIPTQRVAAVYLWQCQECFHACNVMKSENRCICGHRFKEHNVRPAMEAVISRRGGNVSNISNPKCPCTVSKCPCKDFFYMVAEGAWIVRCRCKHKHVEHDPNPPYFCTKCQKVPAPAMKSAAKCCGFESPFVCNCDHPWSSHAQKWELRELSALPQVLDEFGDPSVVKRGL